jgi:PAS domain S-box-containing protein
MMKNGAMALVESVLSASRNTIAATDMVDNLVLDNLADVAALTGMRFQEGELDPNDIARTCLATGINRMDVLDSTGRVAVSSVVDMMGRYYDSTFMARFPFDEILMAQVRSASFILDDENPVIPPQLVLASARMDEPGAVILFADYSILERFGDRIGIGTLLKRIDSESDIEYVFVQSEQGVILSSRNIDRVLRIETDPFLLMAISSEGYSSRVREFEGKDVLEVARPFEAGDFPPGLLRIGLSMEGYHQVAGNFEAQLIGIGAIMFIVSFLVVTLFLANLNYRTLESSYQRMRTVTGNILNAMQSAVVVTDDSGLITLFNPRAEEMFGYDASNVVGQKYADIFEDDTLVLEEVKKTPDVTVRTEKAITLRDGRRLMLLIAASQVIGEDGVPIGSVSVIYDVTESRRLERSAKRSERLSELGNLAAGVAHEIRNPLNAISIASQRLKSEFAPPSDREEYDQLVGNIKSEIERLNDIINQFLALARTHAAKKDLCDITALTEDVISLMHPEAESKGIKLESRIDGDLVVEGSGEELKKVLINLIKNSIEACGKSDSVQVGATILSDADLQLCVEDTGPGIADEDREKIFRPYFTPKENGTGLGLALSHRIIADHDGEIEYEDISSGGSRFLITLPRLKEVK